MVEILDTTLREGEQTPYVNFTIDEKVEIARMLDHACEPGRADSALLRL